MVVLLIVICLMSMAQRFRWCGVEKSKGGCVIKYRRGIMVVEEYQRRKHRNKMKMKDGEEVRGKKNHNIVFISLIEENSNILFISLIFHKWNMSSFFAYNLDGFYEKGNMRTSIK